MILRPQVCPAAPLALSYLWTSCHLREPLGPTGDLWVRTSVHTILNTVQHPHGADQIWGAHPTRELQVCSRWLRVAAAWPCPLGCPLVFVSVVPFSAKDGEQ